LPSISVAVPDYPFWKNELIAPDATALDALAGERAGAARGDAFVFLCGSAPLALFERTLAGAPSQGALWILHLSGYFGGVWLRGEIRRAQPDSMLARAGAEPTRESFLALVERARPAVAAARAGDTALRHCERSLDELAATYGYNQGYLLEIVGSPPAGLRAEKDRVTPRGPFRCDFARPRLPTPPPLLQVSERLAGEASPPWPALRARLLPILDTESARGRGVWSSGLSVQGFGQASYARLLDVSSSFLEAIQSVALTLLRVHAEGDASEAVRATLAHAGTTIWLGSYLLGLMDRRYDARQEPPFPTLT
jgi:hypothetical protein